VPQKNKGVSQKNKNKNFAKKRITKYFGGSDPMNLFFNCTLIAPENSEYSEYSEISIPMQWPPCYYDDWTPPMDYYQPCNNNIDLAQAPPQQPDQDYWPGQIFPDCCIYECTPECFPGPKWGIFPVFLQVIIFFKNSAHD
jgi:hypothetical protein